MKLLLPDLCRSSLPPGKPENFQSCIKLPKIFLSVSPSDFSDYTMVVGAMEAHYTMAILGLKKSVAVRTCNREMAAL